jgi:hypothetical protein
MNEGVENNEINTISMIGFPGISLGYARLINDRFQLD